MTLSDCDDLCVPETEAGGQPTMSQEWRLTARVLSLWRERRGEERPMPHLRDIDPSAFGEDWRFCFLLDLSEALAGGELSQGVFVHVGDALTAPQGVDAPTGRTVRDVTGTPGETLLSMALRHAKLALERQTPCSHGGDIRIDGRLFLYRSILLPLADDGGRVGALLGAANGREVLVTGPTLPSGERGDG